MTYLRNSILATIVYYDVFEHPLTLVEVHKFLINPARISKVEGLGDISLVSIARELEYLSDSNVIGRRNGFYFLKGRDRLYELRMERDLIAAMKWKKLVRLVRFLALAPYLRGVFVSGSMGVGNTDPKSDFDLLIIAKAGRLYTCRLFLWLISSILGVRRKKTEKSAPDKLCFNHYITDTNLTLAHESIFNAQTYINLKPVMVPLETIDKFYASNLWLNNYIYNFNPQKEFIDKTVRNNLFFRSLSRGCEKLLDVSFGSFAEKNFRELQKKKIVSDPVTYRPGGRIVFNDQELEFHPASFERIVLEEYKKGLRKMGIVSFIDEKDSGLS